MFLILVKEHSLLVKITAVVGHSYVLYVNSDNAYDYRIYYIPIKNQWTLYILIIKLYRIWKSD